MSNEGKLYHHPNEVGYWTGDTALLRDIKLQDGTTTYGSAPVGIQEENGTLAMRISTFDGIITVPVDSLPGLKVVTGDSRRHPHETNGELLIEFNYFKIDKMENKPRRFRPTGIMFGILGDTELESAQKGGHRAMGESADYYLEGQDTQYDPGIDKNRGVRSVPFWRIGIWGEPERLAQEYLPSFL